MIRKAQATVLAAVLGCLVAGPPAAAEDAAARRSGEIAWIVGEVPVAGAAVGGSPAGGGIDAGLFAQELVAFALKEAFPDAEDEYEGISGIRGPLDTRRIDVRNRFGERCLWMVNRLWGAAVDSIPFGGSRGRTLVEDPVRRHGTTLVAGSLLAHGLWEALRNEIVDRRDGMALRPKLSARKVALEVKYRW